ncbi:MAG: hypothetical protein ABI778_10150 [Ignavibacteriota bacterium]
MITIEAGGNAGILSLNCYYTTEFHLGLRGGFGLFPYTNTEQPATTPVVLLMMEYFAAVPKSFFLEFGLGPLYAVNSGYFESSIGVNGRSKFLLTAVFGVCYVPDHGGVTYSFSFTPFFGFRSRPIFPSVGFSIGYSF